MSQKTQQLLNFIKPSNPINLCKTNLREVSVGYVQNKISNIAAGQFNSYDSFDAKILYKINLNTCKDSTLILRYHKA